MSSVFSKVRRKIEYIHNKKATYRESGRQPGTVSDGFYKMSIYG